MSRNLVVCFDGTNNQFGSENTNVVRLVQSLLRDPAKQWLYYDPGVGTMPEPGAFTKAGKWLSKAWGLAFGAGFTGKVEEAYTWLMDSFEPGDQVFLFGFGRGAYSARVLAGLLHALGLMPRGAHNMVPYAMKLYRAIRDQAAAQDQGASASAAPATAGGSDYWKLCDAFRWTFAKSLAPGDDDRRFPTHFLGVWDTVSSLGWVWDPPSGGMSYYPQAPVFAVEVRSSRDYGPRAEESLAQKRADYFAAGTQVVWDVDLLSEDVVRKYAASDPQHPTIFRRGQLADAEPAVPQLAMEVDELFR